MNFPIFRLSTTNVAGRPQAYCKMSLSHPPSQIDHRKRKVHHVLDHYDETPSSVRPQSPHKRRCRPDDSPHPLVPTEHDIPTLVTSTSVSSPQTPNSPASFPGSAIQPILPSGKSLSIHVPSPECPPAPNETPPVVQPVQRASSPPEETESPPTISHRLGVRRLRRGLWLQSVRGIRTLLLPGANTRMRLRREYSARMEKR